ncbi:Golgi-associated RAB2 interactor protein 5B isoform X1 [Arvicanthis niloticus]|uniref:Golgi-associated RAB2 interactor protein 5B isoform X1 n=2 Tax=Arvicanthis niloticus TaxID=61156 RepID=UPI00402B748B
MRRLWNFFHPPPPEPPKWVPILGEMQKTLQMAEYLPLRPLPMFESNFTQVTNTGTPALLHNKSNKLTMGVAASLPGLVLPDILLIARPPEGQECSSLILTRMIPLDLASLYVHDLPTWRLKLRLRTGRHYFLALDAPEHELAFLFDRWIRLINMLREPKLSWPPKNRDNSQLDTTLEGNLASTWHFQTQPQGELTVEVTGHTFPCKIFSSQKPKKTKVKLTKPIKHTLRSQAVGDSVPLIWSQLQPSEDPMKVTKKKSYLDACSDRPESLIRVSEKASITIRTIFSIISNSINQAYKSDSEEDTGRCGLIETPTKCISRDSSKLPVLVSSDHLDTLLWAQNLEDFTDTESTTLTSLNTSHPPAFYIFPKSKDKARSTGSEKHMRPLSPHKAASVPIKSGKMPFILDKSKKLPAKPATAQMATGLPIPSPKTPTSPWSRQKSSATPQPSVSQKTPTIPGHPWKPQVVTAPTQNTLTPKQKLLQAPARSQEAMHPQKDHLLINTPSQKDPTARYQKALDSWAKAPVDPSTLQEGDVLERKSEGKQEPVLLMEEKNTKTLDMRAQTMPLHLPLATTKKHSKELLISKTQEVTPEALKGREDRAHKMEEETTVNMPDLKSKETEIQKNWVSTKEMAVEDPYTEDNRPFSAEGLALAKMVIMANSKHQHLKPATISLPSSFSRTSKVSTMSVLASLSLKASQLTFPEGTPIVVIEQSGSHTKLNKERTHLQMERNLPEDLPRTSQEPTSLDDMSRPMTFFTYTTSPTYGTSVTVPQRPAVQHQGFKEQSQHPPLVVTELTSEIPPVTLRMENKGKMATKVGVPVKESGARHSQ